VVIPPDTVKRGRGGKEEEKRGKGQGRGGPQFTLLATPLILAIAMFEYEKSICSLSFFRCFDVILRTTLLRNFPQVRVIAEIK